MGMGDYDHVETPKRSRLIERLLLLACIINLVKG